MLSLPSPSRRWLMLAGAVVLIGAVSAAFLLLRARSDAREAAEVRRARLAFDQAVTRTIESIQEPAGQAASRLDELRGTLEAHLTEPDRPAQALRDRRARLEDQLAALAARLADAAQAPTPAASDALDEDDREALSRDTAAAQQRAGALADELHQLATDSEEWAQALADLRTNAQAFVEVSTSQAPTTNPSRLIAQWEAERAPLTAYRDAAAHAKGFPGLTPVAEVHRRYAEANLAWIDEAVELLEADRLDAYNRRLREMFDVDDPFGFRASLTEATEASLGSGVLAELDQARADATSLAEQAARVEADASARLAPDDAGHDQGGAAAG